ncbi:MAG: acryloyl-CoA reductase electron transfer subunit beta [Oscillospiraceae bacterium]|jgi:electron transfer flavoprotein alpha subunit
MATFNNTDLAAYKDVWVYCEQRQGKLMPTDFELISEGRKLADELGVQLCGLLLGDNVEGLAKELGSYGADKVYVCNSPLMKEYTTDAYAKVISDAVNELKPEIVLFGATNIGRDLAPRCAARLHTGLCADCTHLDVDVPNYVDFLREASTLDVDNIEWNKEDRNLKMTRPAFGGHLMATIICPRFRPAMATVRPGVLKKSLADQAKADACEVVMLDVALTEADIQTEVLEVVKAAKKLVDLIGAEFVVSVGRGIAKDIEGGVKLAHELADELGGVVGGSRATIDSGWLSADHQVGQTGKTVRPKVYVALGISGAIQHKAGMQDSECIIAVNKNPDAPMFEIADYGIIGDLFKVTPLLIESIRAAKAAK